MRGTCLPTPAPKPKDEKCALRVRRTDGFSDDRWGVCLHPPNSVLRTASHPDERPQTQSQYPYWAPGQTAESDSSPDRQSLLVLPYSTQKCNCAAPWWRLAVPIAPPREWS